MKNVITLNDVADDFISKVVSKDASDIQKIETKG